MSEAVRAFVKGYVLARRLARKERAMLREQPADWWTDSYHRYVMGAAERAARHEDRAADYMMRARWFKGD